MNEDEKAGKHLPHKCTRWEFMLFAAVVIDTYLSTFAGIRFDYLSHGHFHFRCRVARGKTRIQFAGYHTCQWQSMSVRSRLCSDIPYDRVSTEAHQCSSEASGWNHPDRLNTLRTSPLLSLINRYFLSVFNYRNLIEEIIVFRTQIISDQLYIFI